MKIIMFAGAGAVGKTTLMEACKNLAESRGMNVYTGYSTTRQTYARYGLEKENDALKDPDFNMKFQGEVMSDQICATLNSVSIHDGNNGDLFLADRTPYDYASYFFTVFQDRLNIATIKDKREKSDNNILALLQYAEEIRIIVLPYPAPWSVDTESSDNWRADKTGKNFVWSSVVEAELESARRRLAVRIPTWYKHSAPKLVIERLNPFSEHGSVDVRAAAVLSSAFPDWTK